MRELDRETAHAARRRVNKHGLPGLQRSVIEQRLPGCQPGDGHGGRLHEIQRLRGREVRRERDVLGVPAAWSVGEHRVSRLDA